VEPEEEPQEEPEEPEEPEEEPEAEFGEGWEDWPAEEIIAKVTSRKRSATNVSHMSTPPPARTRQRHVLTEEDEQRMARHR
jgi:hypothetical protein